MEPSSLELMDISIPDGKMAPFGVALPLFRAKKLMMQLIILGRVNVLICLSTQLTMSLDEFLGPGDVPSELSWYSPDDEPVDPDASTVGSLSVSSYSMTKHPGRIPESEQFLFFTSHETFLGFVDLMDVYPEFNDRDLLEMCANMGLVCEFYVEPNVGLTLAYMWRGNRFLMTAMGQGIPEWESKWALLLDKIRTESGETLEVPTKFLTEGLHIRDVSPGKPPDWIRRGMYMLYTYLDEIKESGWTVEVAWTQWIKKWEHLIERYPIQSPTGIKLTLVYELRTGEWGGGNIWLEYGEKTARLVQETNIMKFMLIFTQ